MLYHNILFLALRCCSEHVFRKLHSKSAFFAEMHFFYMFIILYTINALFLYWQLNQTTNLLYNEKHQINQ